jgi:hypothetical protein
MVRNRLVRTIMLGLAAFLMLPAGGETASFQGSSAALLLSPHVHPSESFTWTGRLMGWYIDRRNHGRVRRTTQSIALTCSVRSIKGDSFATARQVKVFIDEHGQSADASGGNGHWISGRTMHSIVFRRGYAFTSGGRPLQEDPVCMFYSSAWFGTPPRTLKSGSSWRFTHPAWIPGLVSNEDGMATVTRLDAARGVVTLHIELKPRREPRVVEQLDVTISHGGVIQTETQRATYSEIPQNGPVHHRFVWSLRGP